MEIVEASAGDLKNIDTAIGTTAAEIVLSFTKIHQALSSTIEKMEDAALPSSMKNFHDKYIAALKKMDSAIVKGAEYANAN